VDQKNGTLKCTGQGGGAAGKGKMKGETSSEVPFQTIKENKGVIESFLPDQRMQTA